MEQRKKKILFTNQQLMEFRTNIFLGVFEFHASFIFCKLSTNGSKMTQQGGKELITTK
jgi:hypothetical protein